jgi:Methylamine utilisation protein MauE
MPQLRQFDPTRCGLLINFLAYFERCCVAIAFGLSAVWKIYHGAEFRIVLSALLPFKSRHNKRLYTILGSAVPIAEFGLAGLLLFSHTPGSIGALAAGLLTIILGSTLFRRDLTVGCGCWSAPRVDRGALIARNVILLALAVSSAPVDVKLTWPMTIFDLVSGALVALLIMEIPTIHTAISQPGTAGS